MSQNVIQMDDAEPTPQLVLHLSFKKAPRNLVREVVSIFCEMDSHFAGKQASWLGCAALVGAITLASSGCSSESAIQSSNPGPASGVEQQFIVKFNSQMEVFVNPGCAAAYLTKAGELNGLRVQIERQIFSGAYVVRAQGASAGAAASAKLRQWPAFLARQPLVEYAEMDGIMKPASPGNPAAAGANSASALTSAPVSAACANAIKRLQAP